MKLILFILMAIFCLQCNSKNENIKNQVSLKKNISSFNKDTFYVDSPDSGYNKQLFAVFNKINFKIASDVDSKESCLSVIDQRDFDNDSYLDALIRKDDACGGNCCGVQYYFVSYKGNRIFKKTKAVGYSWENPIIEKWQGKWSVVVKSVNAGMNNDDLDEITERFILLDGKIIKVEENKPVEIKSIKEIRASQFSFDKYDEIKKITIDLDDDNRQDTIVASFWSRWGEILFSVKFANGKTFESNAGHKRIGVLHSKTNGKRDLVADYNTILIWKDNKYVEADEE